MIKTAPFFISLLCFMPLSHQFVLAEEESSQAEAATEYTQKQPTLQSVEPFTGKVTKNKVRMRLQPNFDGQVIRELGKDQMVIVDGQADDFYAIRPMQDMKAYIYRTFVLDNVIEGTRVNVRLKPDLDSPVIAQLNSGDKVKGQIHNTNSKWMEINIPDAVHFYIAKEYLEKVGDVDHMARTEKRRNDVYQLLNTTTALTQAELQKPFDQIRLESIISNYKHIALDYPDYPEVATKAQEQLNDLQNTYAAKKIQYLEQRSQQASQALEQQNKQLAEDLKAQKAQLTQLQQQLQKDQTVAASEPPTQKKLAPLPFNMVAWIPSEDALFTQWSRETGNDSPIAFYEDQKAKSFTVQGIIDTYNRSVKNKPGDYMLISASTKLPIAYLYSTQVNLQNFVGHEVVIRVSSRPNNNYAFPAYYVHSIE